MNRLLTLLAGLFALTGCTKADLLNATIPRSGYTLHKDIAYGDGKRQKLDIYVPDNAAAADVIVFFYGGGWQRGSKDDYRFVGQAFASKGFITVVADYSLYPEAYFPTFVQDGAQAAVWTHQHIAQYGGNAERIFLAGHSAGAHIAAMLGINERYMEAAGGKRSWIKGVIGLAGPYDFLPMTDPPIIALFSKAKDTDTQPITFVEKNMPPMLLATGDEDDEVGVHNTKNLAAKLRKHGNKVTERIYPGVGHIGMALALARGWRGKAPVLEDIVAFVKGC